MDEDNCPEIDERIIDYDERASLWNDPLTRWLETSADDE